MKRRSFLTMLGIAPVAASLPAVAAEQEAMVIAGNRTIDFPSMYDGSKVLDDGSYVINSVRVGSFRNKSGTFQFDTRAAVTEGNGG